MEINFETKYDIDQEQILVDINGITVHNEDAVTALEYCSVLHPNFKIEDESITYDTIEVHGETLAHSTVQLIALTSTFTYKEIIHNLSISAHHYNTGVSVDRVFAYDADYYIKDILPTDKFIQRVRDTIEGKRDSYKEYS